MPPNCLLSLTSSYFFPYEAVFTYYSSWTLLDPHPPARPTSPKKKLSPPTIFLWSTSTTTYSGRTIHKYILRFPALVLVSDHAAARVVQDVQSDRSRLSSDDAWKTCCFIVIGAG